MYYSSFFRHFSIESSVGECSGANHHSTLEGRSIKLSVCSCCRLLRHIIVPCWWLHEHPWDFLGLLDNPSGFTPAPPSYECPAPRCVRLAAALPRVRLHAFEHGQATVNVNRFLNIDSSVESQPPVYDVNPHELWLRIDRMFNNFPPWDLPDRFTTKYCFIMHLVTSDFNPSFTVDVGDILDGVVEDGCTFFNGQPNHQHPALHPAELFVAVPHRPAHLCFTLLSHPFSQGVGGKVDPPPLALSSMLLPVYTSARLFRALAL